MDVLTYLLAKKYTDTVLEEGNIKGKSAYEIAVANGFQGSEQDWVESLKGDSPAIGENGHWFIGEEDTGVQAAPNLEGYFSEANLIALTQKEILEICK